jgi:hypothetical protein
LSTLKGRRKFDGRFQRAAGVVAREVGDEIFLATPGPGEIHHLDQIASAAWRALVQPKSADELIDLFQAAFPRTPKRKIAKDIADLLTFFEARGLIVRTKIDKKEKPSKAPRDC